MADYRELFSVTIADLTKEEITWIEASLGSAIEVGENDEAILEELGLDEIHQWPPCDWEIQDQAFRSPGLWLHSSDTYDEDALMSWLQLFLRKFRPDKHITLSVACTVSRPIHNASGGRWFVVGSQCLHRGSTWASIQKILGSA